MIERLPERVRTASVARAVTSPSAFLMAGAGMAGAILVGAPIVAAAAVGAAAWAARVALAVPRRPAGERIDPFRVGEPWRRFMADALQAQARYRRTVHLDDAGPIRDRLTAIGRRVDQGVAECWKVVRLGDQLGGAIDRLGVAGIHRQLQEIYEEQRTARDPSARESLDRTRQAVESQLASAERLQRVASDTQNRLRVLTAQLDEAVARAIELSVHTGDLSLYSPLDDDLGNIVEEMEALRQGMEETSGSTGAAGSATA